MSDPSDLSSIAPRPGLPLRDLRVAVRDGAVKRGLMNLLPARISSTRSGLGARLPGNARQVGDGERGRDAVNQDLGATDAI